MAYFKSRFQRGWTGPSIQENYGFRALKGGAYRPGQQFDIQKVRTFSGIRFTPRYYDVNVTEILEELEVEMAGPTAAFKRLDIDMAEAALTLSGILACAIYQNGQDLTASGGADRSAELNGLEEALTDGVNTTFTGSTFTTYGGQQRGAAGGIGNALNSPVGLITPSQATTSFRVLEHSYLSACVGKEHPKLGITTNRMMGYIAETFTPQQKIDTVDPEINWPGLKFNQSTIVMGQYVPGQDISDDDVSQLGAVRPSSGETFWWFNPGDPGDKAYMKLWIAASPKFAFGFTGFKGARDDNMVAGQILFAGNFSNISPRYSRTLYGLTK
jgi:hypothetical protein